VSDPIEVASLPRGCIVPVTLDAAEFVVWRGASGALGSAPRTCPHLDWDLAEGSVVDDDLVCSGHGWAFDCHGHAFKRNEVGRVDPKDDVDTLTLTERAGVIQVSR
jgi:phenylpropionate dioxygenase-like ring-hydroxylating dioxygenase large terminal subunit